MTAREQGLEQVTSRVVEIYVETARRQLPQTIAQILRVITDAGGEPRVPRRPIAFLARAADADRTRTFDPRHLTGHRAGDVGSRGHQYDLAGAQLGEIEQPEVGRHPRRAEETERRRRGGLTGMQRANMVTLGDAHLAHAAVDDDMLSNRKHIVPGLQHFAHTQSGNDITRPRPRTRRRRAIWRQAGERIDGQPARAAEDAAIGQARYLAWHYLEVARGRGCPPDPDFEVAHGPPLY